MLLATLLLTLTAQTAWAAGDIYVGYLDPTAPIGQQRKTVLNPVWVDDNTVEIGTAGETTWYLVSGTVTNNTRIEVKGTVNLILTDGCNFTVSKGIHVPSGSALNIYAQSVANRGSLTANNYASPGNAAIGGNGGEGRDGDATSGESAGDITIYGGNITITNGNIGGGDGGNGNAWTNIYFDEFEKEYSESFAGNGGNGGNGNVTIYSGYVWVKSGNIGGGKAGTGEDSVSGDSGVDGYNGGGTVNLSWANTSDRILADDYYGSVTLQKAFYDFEDANIIDAGVVNNNDLLNRKNLMYAGDSYTVTIGSLPDGVTATADLELSAGVKTAVVGQVVTISFSGVPDGKVPVVSVTYGDNNDNVNDIIDNGDGTFSFVMPNGTVTVTASDLIEKIPYIKNGTTEYCTNYTVLDNTMTTISAGWYVVKNDVTFSGKLYTNANGEVHIILCDGATLTANNIEPQTNNDYLRIYGQSQGTGTANISGYIMGNYSVSIYGGTINAAGDIDCAQGSIGIYGGTVTARSLVALNTGSQIRLGGATVKANNYSAHNGVAILTGITYYDGTGASYTAGNLDAGQISAIRGKTLRTYDYRGGTCGKDDPATGDVDESQNVTWLYNVSTTTLTISGTGAMADYADANYQPWAANRLVIKTIVINEGVTSIGKYAFSNCEEATSVSIPASVTSIGYYSFNYCSNLTSLNIAANSSLKTIDSFAFNCAGLPSVTFPANVTSIGNNAFDGCVTAITFNSNPSIGADAFGSTTVTMNLTANGPVDGAYWTTFYNKGYNFQADANTQVFKAALGGTALTLTELATDQIVNKNNAVILKSTASPIVMTLTTTDSGNNFTGNSLQGVDDPAGLTAADPSTTYVLNNGSNGVGFYKLKAGKTLGVGKAYLTYSGTTAPGFFGLDVDNENTTAINEHDCNATLSERELNESHELSGAWYDLQGRKIANGQKPTAKGLYIVNGKKVMIK